MAAKHTRLELTWIGKDERPRLEPRILLEDPELSYHAKNRVGNTDIFQNLLIHGDNLLALKSLQGDYSGKVRLIYIDPPYNTGNAFEHYDDGLEHSLWLSLIKIRLELLRDLLASNGTICVQIDDHEQAHLRLLMDEIFGAENFIATVSVKMSVAAGLKMTHADKSILKICEYIHIYAKNRSSFTIEDLSYISSSKENYDLSSRRDRILLNPEDPIEEWQFKTVRRLYQDELGNDNYAEINDFVAKYSNRMYTFIENASSRRYWLNLSQANRVMHQDKVRRIENENTKYQYAFNEAVLLPYYSDSNDGNLWLDFHNVGRTAESEGGVSFKNGKKPEKLLERIIGLFTKPGEIVLDSFAGSGTTGAVAHKMRRRWILVELRDHSKTHIVPRLKRVIDGADATGVTNTNKWMGGGGFRFLYLAPSLLECDKWGNWIVSKQYNPEMLAEGMCKLEGFSYAPDPEVFWIHGRSTESDFIYITTQNLSHEQLQFISDQVGDERTLLICCSAFRAKPDAFANLTLKKIPQAVLHRCEWGRDDYSLNVNALPGSEPEADQTDEESSEDIPATDSTPEVISPTPARRRGRPRRQSSTMQELPLFANLDQGGDA
jgi:adenine-specific DNA-methyltransferase